ncbi:MAG: universal stress protein [Desulfobacterales bacterium]|nr:universal stress protein [Desulfobacterales bacterium]
MSLFKNIVIVSASKPNIDVLRQTLALGANSGSDLKILQIVDPHHDRSNAVLKGYPVLQNGWLTDLQAQQGGKANPKLQLRNHRVHSKFLQGDPPEAVEREVERDHHDLIVFDAKQKNVLLHHAIISTAMHLMRRCTTPILISRPDPEIRSNRMLAAVDPMLCSGAFGVTGNALNTQIMTLVNDVALHAGQKVHVLNCWRHPMGERLRKNEHLNDEQVRRVLIAARDQQRKCLVDFLRKTSRQQLRYRIHLRQGDPEKHIASIAEDYRINLVIMGSVGRSGLDGLIVGNTAERIMCNSNISLLTVKPSSYQPIAGHPLTPAEAACDL